jgi:hypothetical protein
MLFEGERIMHMVSLQHIVSLLDDVLELTYDIRATEPFGIDRVSRNLDFVTERSSGGGMPAS